MLKYCIGLFGATIFLMAKPMILGKTYDFAEPDIYNSIKSYINNNKPLIKKQEKIIAKKIKKKILNMKPKVTKILPSADKNITYAIDTTYELEFDIPDTNGNIIYPKGYRFNPLNYTQIPYETIFINAEKKEELEWAKQYAGNAGYKILLTNGTYKSAQDVLKSHVFFATDKILEKFQVRATPTIAAQKKNEMFLTEVKLEKYEDE